MRGACAGHGRACGACSDYTLGGHDDVRAHHSLPARRHTAQPGRAALGCVWGSEGEEGVAGWLLGFQAELDACPCCATALPLPSPALVFPLLTTSCCLAHLPTDALALALQSSAPLFIARRLALAAQPDSPEQTVRCARACMRLCVCMRLLGGGQRRSRAEQRGLPHPLCVPLH